MRRHAKASPAGSISGDGTRFAVGGLVLVAAMLLVSLALASAAVAAPKSVINSFGTTGTAAGQFSTSSSGPGGIAVNNTGAGGVPAGSVYVVDRGNHRVQQLTPGTATTPATFVRTFGFNVGGAGVHVCTTSCVAGTSSSAAGGLAVPQGVAINQTTGQVFVTDQTNRRVDVFSATGVFEGAFGWGADTGAAAFQFCTTASTCVAPAAAGGASGQFGTAMGYLAVNPANGNVLVANATNRRVDEFSIAGSPATGASFVRGFGWDVDSSGGSGALEVCTSACQQAPATGNASGQFGANGATRVAVDSTGFVYAVDPSNFRVQKFNPAATSAVIFAPATVSGTKSATTPLEVSVEPSTDNVYVIKAYEEKEGTPLALVDERRVLVLDSSGALLDTHMVNAGINVANGLGYGAGSGNVYVSSTTGNARVFILGTPVLPTPAMDPVTTFGTTTATFNGTVNPNNGWQTTYHFEYKLFAAPDLPTSWKAVPAIDVDAGSGGSPNPVTQAAVGLEPNTTYQVRLVASRPFNGGKVNSSPVQFTTNSAVPDVTNVHAFEIGATTAILAGKIDPNSQATSYHFEYGLDTSYGQSTPVTSAGSGSDPKVVTAALTGLQPGATYHFKLKATNTTGTTESADTTFVAAPSPTACANEALRIEQGAQLLPDCRAWEMVSPVDKGGNSVALYAPGLATADGESILYPTLGAFPVSNGNALPNGVHGARGAGSWTYSPAGVNLGMLYSVAGAYFRTLGASVDGSHVVVTSQHALTPGAWEGNYGQLLPLYVVGTEPGAVPRLLTPQPVSGTPAPYVSAFVWGNEDFSEILFQTAAELTADATPLADSALKVYRWDEGTITLESVVGGVGVSAFGGSSTNATFPEAMSKNAMSRDGGAVWFTSPTTSGSLYRRAGGQTVRANASENTGEVVGAGAAEWYGSSASGEKTIFTSTQKLLVSDTDTTADLYMFTNSANPESENGNLTLISAGTTDPVLGVFGYSEDLSRVFFVTGAGSGNTLPRDIHLWNSGTLRHSGVVTAGSFPFATSGQAWAKERGSNTNMKRYVAAEGSALLLVNNTQLDPERDNGGFFQIYRWGLDDEQFHCLSCPPSGVPATGPSRARTDKAVPYQSSPWGWDRRNLSDDGSRAFFTAYDDLVAADTNGKTDVYQWENGKLSLISSGRADEDAFFMDASADGDSVFFGTFEPLVGWDPDRLADTYVARVDGGFPEPPPVGAPCEGEGCRGAGTSAPPTSGAGSAVFQGPGNKRPDKVTKCPSGKRKVKGKNGKSRCVPKAKPKKKSGKNGKTRRAGK